MDKKKVKELVEDTLLMVDTIEGYDDGDTEQLLNVRRKLNDALEELSKSDWVSVEDGLPEYGEEVLVTSNVIPDDVMFSYRTKKKHPSKDQNDFYCPNSYIVTHWKPIEKLEE